MVVAGRRRQRRRRGDPRAGRRPRRHRRAPRGAQEHRQQGHRRVHPRRPGVGRRRGDRRGRDHRRHRHRPGLHARRLRRARHRTRRTRRRTAPTAPARSPRARSTPTKFLGGYDFAGPLYDADGEEPGSTTDRRPTPTRSTPPPTATAGTAATSPGTAAGYGVHAPTATTFDGDYATLTDISDWQIGPGTAPEAGIYALKVFGDVGGSTGLVITALEWAADPNGDGDLSDHLDIINMSLGSDSSPADDPENLFVDALAELGVLSVTSVGQRAATSPTSAAARATRAQLADRRELGRQHPDVRRRRGHRGRRPGPGRPARRPEHRRTTPSADDVTAPVDLPRRRRRLRPLARSPPTPPQITGKIVWLSWDDNDTTRACGSAARWNNAAAAGAVGVLIGTELPGLHRRHRRQRRRSRARSSPPAATDALLPEIQAGTLVVHIGPSLANAAFVTDPSLGRHAQLRLLARRPRLARHRQARRRRTGHADLLGVARAPATTARPSPGTSMATAARRGHRRPRRQRRTRAGTPEQIKAAVMNTATHDVYSELGQTGPVYGPERVGSGRVDALDADADRACIAYATDDPTLVSVTFGVVPSAPRPWCSSAPSPSATRDDSAHVRDVVRPARPRAGGATITTSPASLTVPAGGSAQVTVTLTADPATLAKDLDPTSVATYDLGIDVPRDYVATISGRLVLTPSGGPELRVPVQAAPRLVSDLSAAPVAFADEARHVRAADPHRARRRLGRLDVARRAVRARRARARSSTGRHARRRPPPRSPPPTCATSGSPRPHRRWRRPGSTRRVRPRHPRHRHRHRGRVGHARHHRGPDHRHRHRR